MCTLQYSHCDPTTWDSPVHRCTMSRLQVGSGIITAAAAAAVEAVCWKLPEAAVAALLLLPRHRFAPISSYPIIPCLKHRDLPIPVGSCARALRIGRVSFSLVEPASVNSPDKILELISSSSPAAACVCCFVLSSSDTALCTVILLLTGRAAIRLADFAVSTGTLLL